jgi:hypothetical protein
MAAFDAGSFDAGSAEADSRVPHASVAASMATTQGFFIASSN